MFQSEVKAGQALGNVGQISKAHHSFLNVIPAVVTDDNVSVGAFVQSVETPVNENEVKGTSGQEITGTIVGVVVRDSLKVTGDSTATLAIKKGENCAVLNEGSIFIETNLVAKKGQFVFLKTADGELAFDDTNEKENYTYTGFRVSKGNESANRGVIEITTARA